VGNLAGRGSDGGRDGEHFDKRRGICGGPGERRGNGRWASGDGFRGASGAAHGNPP